MQRMRILVCSTVIPAVMLATAPAASAQQRPPRPDDTAAISVYMEIVPTSGGPEALPPTTPGAPSSENGSVAPTPLSASARRSLRTAPRAEADTLERIATSPRYGAPERRGSAEAVAAADDDAASAPSTLLRTALDSARLVVLIAGLVLLAAGAALYARRRAQPPPAA